MGGPVRGSRAPRRLRGHVRDSRHAGGNAHQKGVPVGVSRRPSTPGTLTCAIRAPGFKLADPARATRANLARTRLPITTVITDHVFAVSVSLKLELTEFPNCH